VHGYGDALVAHRRRRRTSALVLIAGCACLANGLWRWMRAAPLSIGGLRMSPVAMTAAGVAAALAAWRRWPRDDPARWLRGAAGEQATAALLARLPRRRWTVLHDRAVPGSRANLDHVVIGPTGVWVVDSKAYRAPLRIRRGRVWAGSRPVPTGAVAWEAERVGERLGVDVTPIVAVHGDGLRRRGRRSDGVRVVPASGLLRRLRRGRLRRRRRVLGRDEAAEVARRAAQRLPPHPG
jgi:hypothetical protein